jgi:outer membrane protein insertion porin family
LEVKMRRLVLIQLMLLLAAAAISAPDEAPILQDIRFEGLVRLDPESVLYYSTLERGQPYTDEAGRQDFRTLWDTGFFEELWLEKEESIDGVVLTYHVVERPQLASVTYQGNDKLLTEDIRENLATRGIEFVEGSYFGLGDVERARSLIRDLLGEMGFRFGDVQATVTDAPEGGKNVVFQIDEGASVKISRIEFEGNRAFDDGQLRGAFEKTTTAGMFCFIRKKCVFNEASLREDLENLRSFYMDRGYLRFNNGEPDVQVVEENGDRRVHIVIPVTEGDRYRVSSVSVEGNEAFPTEALLQLNQLKAGEPYDRSQMLETRKLMGEVYGVKGYFNAFVAPRALPNEEAKTVDIIYDITENDIYHVHRINFTGNTTTKDKVIRRQMSIQEQQVFNTALFERSLMRIYQLGYFAPPEPHVEPSTEDPTGLDITIAVEEQARNDVRFGGGVSGVEGAFFTFAFSTRNLFGTGNSLTVDSQVGGNVKNYRLAYTDPFLWDRPITAGFDVFSNTIAYPQFDREGQGARISLGFLLRDFWFFGTDYLYEDVSSKENVGVDEGDIDPYLLAIYNDTRTVSALTPRLVYSTIDNPIKPWRGLRQVFSLEYAGGFLGGTTDFWKPITRTTLFKPLTKRTGFALHAEGGYVEAFNNNTIPVYERFFLGGDRSIRGYPTLEISPRPPDNPYARIGGNKYVQFNAEYQIRITDPLSVVTFFDAGNAFNDDEKIDFKDLYKSAGLEVRFYTPILQAPMRLIWSYKLDADKFSELSGRTEPQTDFTFSIGTTF